MADVDSAHLDGEASDTLLRKAKLQLQKGRLSDAIAALEELLHAKPAHRDGLYYLAVCQRKAQAHQAALATLKKLKQSHPQYGRAYQEEGHTYSTLGNSQAAGEAFEKAVALNPALIASWKALVVHYDAQAEKEKAMRAMQHAHGLSQLPPHLLTVTSLIHENKLYMAEQLCRQFLQQQPHHIEAMRLLAEIGTKLQILDDAEFLLESCVEFKPDYQRARMDYVQVLHKRQKFQQALEQAEQLHASDPDNVAYEIALASENQAVGDFDRALAIYQRIIARKPDVHTVHSARGHALKTIGRTDDAIQSYRTAYKAKPDFGDAYWSLANLKTYAFTDNELAHMREQEQLASTTPNDRVHLCFALGKALEDREEFAESFSFYERGNRLKQEESQYLPERIETDFATQKELFDADFFARHQGSGCPSDAPIFVVGLPRAGSTLLEQILASHSQIDGTMELANI
ncbi:MAG: tetratricopeptide repeat protein, partial [Pseudomonadales bacterium]